MEKEATTGKLRIGDHWNAITILALSQSNPLKAIAEFVENSIDARSQHVTIIRGKEKGNSYLEIIDDGEGIPRDEAGLPNFRYVATHICDSIKRRLKSDGTTGIQGEFGIGLLSFWTVGGMLLLTSSGTDGKAYQMHMRKGDPTYRVQKRRGLFPQKGTELRVQPLLAGIKQLSGEKIQWYLSSELRDRIRTSGVQVKVIDRHARKVYKVEPRQFSGQLLHQLSAPVSPLGNVYLELYLAPQSPENHVGLYRSGTRVLERLDEIELFQKEPWTSSFLQGIVDVPYLNLSPGNRTGVIHDEAFASFCLSLKTVEETLSVIINDQRRAEEEKTSQQILRSIQKAFQEALIALPSEEYDWFPIRGGENGRLRNTSTLPPGVELSEGSEENKPFQKDFFEFPGPLYSVTVSPSSSVVSVGTYRNLRAIPRDRTRRLVEENLSFRWEILEGGGSLNAVDTEVTTFEALKEPALVRVQVTVRQGNLVSTGMGVLTVTDSLLPKSGESLLPKQGLPGYTFQSAAGELWRSCFDQAQNVVVVNKAHRDFVFASRNRARQLRYICRLFAKELVYKNFPGLAADQLLERLIELSLYSEENL